MATQSRSLATPTPRLAIGPLYSGNVAVFCLALQFVCQTLLLFPELAAFRIPFRIAAFATSLAALILIPALASATPYPGRPLGIMVLVIIGLNILQPDTALMAGIATWFLNLAILAPIFWSSRLAFRASHFRKILLVLFFYHTCSSIVGVLQVHYPGRFQPALSTVYSKQSEEQLGGLQIVLADGSLVFRPMGLTDTPGGAASSGFYACLLGTCILFSERSAFLRLCAFVALGAGLFCLYLSQVRVMIVLLAIDWIAFVFLLARTGRVGQAARLAVMLAFIVPAIFLYAFAVGGETVTNRLMTLTEGGASDVYYSNRGLFLDYTLNTLLPRYPLGGGLGRWGMMCAYFGDPNNSVWAEIQWTGWLYDGGVPLMLTYGMAILFAIWVNWKGASESSSEQRQLWFALVFAYSVGALASTFSALLFAGQAGMEFWLINAALFQANTQEAHLERGRPVAKKAPSDNSRKLVASFGQNRSGATRASPNGAFGRRK